jgi:hypothetical protein
MYKTPFNSLGAWSRSQLISVMVEGSLAQEIDALETTTIAFYSVLYYNYSMYGMYRANVYLRYLQDLRTVNYEHM